MKAGVFVQEGAADRLSPIACEWTCSLVHPDRELERVSRLAGAVAQSEFRAAAICEAFEAGGYSGPGFAAVAGGGGLLPPLECGTWVVNEGDD